MQLMDAWTETFADPGKRTTGTGEGWFAIVGPGWRGKLPPGVHKLAAATNTVWLLGRTQTNTAADYENVRRIQKGFTLTPLSRYPEGGPPPPSNEARSGVSSVPPPARVARLSAAGIPVMRQDRFPRLLRFSRSLRFYRSIHRDLDSMIKISHSLDPSSGPLDRVSYRQIGEISESQESQESR